MKELFQTNPNQEFYNASHMNGIANPPDNPVPVYTRLWIYLLGVVV